MSGLSFPCPVSSDVHFWTLLSAGLCCHWNQSVHSNGIIDHGTFSSFASSVPCRYLRKSPPLPLRKKTHFRNTRAVSGEVCCCLRRFSVTFRKKCCVCFFLRHRPSSGNTTTRPSGRIQRDINLNQINKMCLVSLNDVNIALMTSFYDSCHFRFKIAFTLIFSRKVHFQLNSGPVQD